MERIINYIFQYWQEIITAITFISFVLSLFLNIINRKIKDNVYYVLREIEITSNTLMRKLKDNKSNIDNCYEAFRANRSLAAAGMRMIVPTSLTREQYEKGLIYRFLLGAYRIAKDVRTGFSRLFSKIGNETGQ